MFLVNDTKFLETLTSKEDLGEKDLFFIPEGMTKEITQRMLRVLSAVSPKEIDDIETEEIFDLFDYVQDIAPYLGKTNHFDNGFMQTLKSKKSACISRRVL